MSSGLSKPLIIVDFEVDAESVFLVIKNGGAKPALNVKVRPEKPILGLEGQRNIAELSLFKKISYLAPLKEIRVFVDSYESFFFHLNNPIIVFDVRYRRENGKKIKKEIIHDLKIYADLIYFVKKNQP